MPHWSRTKDNFAEGRQEVDVETWHRPVVEQPPTAGYKQNEEETMLTDKLLAQIAEAYALALQSALE